MFTHLATTFPQLVTACARHEIASARFGEDELWESAWQAAAYADALDAELIVDGEAFSSELLWLDR